MFNKPSRFELNDPSYSTTIVRQEILEKNFGGFCNVKVAYYIPLESLAAEVVMDPIGAAMAIALTVSLFKRNIRIIP